MEAAERFIAAFRSSRAIGHRPMTAIPKKRATEKTAKKKLRTRHTALGCNAAKSQLSASVVYNVNTN
jgi:hypothetical protein